MVMLIVLVKPNRVNEVLYNLMIAEPANDDSRAGIIRNYIAIPEFIPGVRVFDGEFLAEDVARVKQNGVILVELKAGTIPTSKIVAAAPGSLGLFEEWGDIHDLFNIKKILEELT